MNEEQQSHLGRDYFWNTAASLMLAMTTAVMLLVVVRAAGVWAGGVFSLANALGQQFQTLGMYEVRTYHVTDLRHRFSFGTYLATRLVTVTLMVVGITGYALITEGDLGLAALVALIAFLRVFDAFEDVFYCEFQRQGRLDLAGRACFWRTLTTIVSFSVAMVIWQSLLVAALVALVVTFGVLVVAYLPPAQKMFSLRPVWDHQAIISVLVECLPLFMASFIAMYLANAPRFAIGHFLDNEQQGYFAIIFMPAFTINLFSTVIFRPLLTQMAQAWIANKWRRFISLVGRGLLGTTGAFVVVAVVSYLVGIPILELVYGKDVSDLLMELMVLVAGGAMNSASVVLYYALTTMRLQGFVFVGYVVAGISATILCLVLVPMAGLMGASAGYAVAMAVLAGTFAVGIARGRRRSPGGE